MKKTLVGIVAAAAALTVTGCSADAEPKDPSDMSAHELSQLEKDLNDDLDDMEASIDAEGEKAFGDAWGDGEDAGSPAGVGEVHGPGVYVATLGDAAVQLEVPAEEGLPADVEALRQQMGVKPPTYIKASIDNTYGGQGVEPVDVVIVTEDGETITFESLTSYLDEDEMTPPSGSDLYSESVGVYNDHLEDGEVRRGAKDEAWFVYPGTLGSDLSIRHVTVEDPMFTGEATWVEDAK